jgi:hypothetical protein
MSLHEQPLFTREMPREELRLATNSTYLHGQMVVEERGAITPEWVAPQATNGVRFIEIEERGESVSFYNGRTRDELYLTDEVGLRAYLASLGGAIYLDITSLSHSSWAPLVRAAVFEEVDLNVVYLEPASYRRSPRPSPGLIFDLSERIDGVAPLPGFAKITGSGGKPDIFLPLLGFEGARFAFLLENLQIANERVFPVIGVPGFRPEFPFDAYAGNRLKLQGELSRSIRYAKANCPFDLFHEIYRVHREYSGSLARVAPIGTKPHALGAVLYAISNPGAVELIYDHPVRSAQRTQGEARLCLYDVAAFVKSSLFLGEASFPLVA